MHITSKGPINFELHRSGGAIVAARLDVWKATESGWTAVQSAVFQDITSAIEQQTFQISSGSYTAVLVCHVEESINGIFSLRAFLDGTLIAEKEGDVDTTSQPQDIKVYKNQFIIDVIGA